MQERVLFELDFQYTYDTVCPKIQVYIDNQHCATLDKQSSCKFYHAQDFGSHELRIERSGKDHTCPEQMVQIQRIRIDGIDIRNMMYHKSVCNPEYPEPWATEQREAGVELEKDIIGETVFGHNCTWSFNYTSPFWHFVMEQIR